MSTDATKSMIIPAPRKSIVRATVTTFEALVLPLGFYQGWIELHNDGAGKIGVKFGTTVAEVSAMTTLTAVSGGVPIVSLGEVTLPAGTPGLVLEPGERVYRCLEDMDFASLMNADTRIFMAHLATATGGYLRICQSSGPTPA